MNVLLVFPPPGRESIDTGAISLVEPLTLEYIGAGIQADHDVRLIDLRLKTGPGLKDTLEAFKPDIVACTGLTPDVNGAKQVFSEAKKRLPGVLTVAGGIHATVMPEDYFADTVDVVVMGEGVHPFKKICAAQEKQESFADIDNIYYRTGAKTGGTGGPGGQWVFTRQTAHPPLDSLPFPARDLTSRFRHHYYNYLFFKPVPVALIRGSLGCIFRCHFCAVSSMLKGKLYRHSVERITAELASLTEPHVLWVDDEFLLDAQQAMLLAKEIEKAGIKKTHTILSRSDTIVKNPGCIEEWVKIGLKEVLVGFESHRENDLKKMRKGTTLSRNEEVVRILHQNNIIIRGNFIVQPDFTSEDFRQLAEYIRNLEIDTPSLTAWTPLPGTPLYEEEKNNLITRNYNLFDLFHTVLPTRLPLKQFFKDYACYFGQTISPEKKMAALKQIPPQERWKFMEIMSKFVQSLENGYIHYDKSLW